MATDGVTCIKCSPATHTGVSQIRRPFRLIFSKLSRFSALLLPISQLQHASPMPSLLNVAAQPVAADPSARAPRLDRERCHAAATARHRPSQFPICFTAPRTAASTPGRVWIY
ncbi:hypothetical protein B0H10DRAFT_2437333 [Mycena sp. CBHHK59/15]|nr:hypothetical protein B0H10DRAFT_2447409 [Mycena sp. CBHHK59/15]KAJ6611682.1 hypothetical protein B0H10DRAFT_2437333 [Mycena sp. CBHHK59/15]